MTSTGKRVATCVMFAFAIPILSSSSRGYYCTGQNGYSSPCAQCLYPSVFIKFLYFLGYLSAREFIVVPWWSSGAFQNQYWLLCISTRRRCEPQTKFDSLRGICVDE